MSPSSGLCRCWVVPRGLHLPVGVQQSSAAQPCFTSASSPRVDDTESTLKSQRRWSAMSSEDGSSSNGHTQEERAKAMLCLWPSSYLSYLLEEVTYTGSWSSCLNQLSLETSSQTVVCLLGDFKPSQADSEDQSQPVSWEWGSETGDICGVP
ncbi:hypothetical protein ACRRTK_003011 [Alexandromys fortis]